MDAIDDLVRNGAIEKIVSMLKSHKGSVEANSLMIEALCRICVVPKHVAEAVRFGAVAAVMESADAPEAQSNRGDLDASVLKFLSVMARTKDSAKAVCAAQGVDVVVEKMKMRNEDQHVQQEGIATLSTLLTTLPSSSGDMTRSGAVPMCFECLMNHCTNLRLVQETLRLLTTLSQTPEGLIQSLDLADAALGPIVLVAVSHIHDPGVRQLAAVMISKVATPTMVQQHLARLRGLEESLQNGNLGPGTIGDDVLPLVMTLTTLALLPEYRQQLLGDKAFKPLTTILEVMATATPFNGQPQVLSALTTALDELVLHLPTLSMLDTTGPDELVGPDNQELEISKVNMVHAATVVLDKHLDEPDTVTCVLRLLEHLSSDPGLTKAFADHQTVSVVLRCLKSYIASPEFTVSGIKDPLGISALLPATAILANIVGTSPAAAKSLTKQHITRSLVQCLVKAAPQDGPDALQALEQIVFTLDEIVKSDSACAATISRQGGVNAVLAALEAHQDDEQFVRQAKGLLASLVTDDDVLRVLRKLQVYDLPGITDASPEKLGKIARDVEKLGFLLLNGDFVELVNKHRGLDSLASLLQAAQQAQDCPEKRDLLKELIQGFCHAANNVDALKGMNNAAVIPFLVDHLVGPNTEAQPQAVAAVASLVKHPDSLRVLMEMGGHKVLLDLLSTSLLDPTADPALIPLLLDTFQTIARDPQGAEALLDMGLLQKLRDLVQNALDTRQDGDTVTRAVRLLRTITAESCSPEVLVPAGTLSFMAELLDILPGLATSNEAILADLMSVAAALLTDPGHAQTFDERNIVPKMLNVLDQVSADGSTIVVGGEGHM